jgi:hypothetical protein
MTQPNVTLLCLFGNVFYFTTILLRTHARTHARTHTHQRYRYWSINQMWLIHSIAPPTVCTMQCTM